MSPTLIILIVTVVISIMGLNNPNLLYKLTMSPYAIREKKEYWRFLTSGFVHNSWMHLGFNMFTFFFFGQAAEQIIGYYSGGSSIQFIVFYLVAIGLSDVPSYFKNRNSIHYQSLGASGGVTAVVFCSILLNPLNKIYLFGLIGLPGFILGVLYLIYTINQSRQMSDNINHMAHLTGAIVGIVYSIFIHPGVVGDFFEKVASYKLFG
ncbi:rhomboid family intramembrane serine protease [Imperialibacter roseus]|uniref:Rhomboid family intramembrane serine protease n=1 Tax=Imperialibacter roseus TaxID=1324217 RepID=A0ABZ0INQ0_9BACT|nr:rhomboid family intramembrane serine protease [Imperialibacter roseus]WOK06634.1 rhomboid family intramembrane serine protease [Imperialibacter roseus]